MQAAAPGTPGALALRMRSNVTRSIGLPLRVGGLAGLALLARLDAPMLALHGDSLRGMPTRELETLDGLLQLAVATRRN